MSILDLPPCEDDAAVGDAWGCQDEACADGVTQGMIEEDAGLDAIGAKVAAAWNFEDAAAGSAARGFMDLQDPWDHEGHEIQIEAISATAAPQPTPVGGRSLPSVCLTPRLVAQRPQTARADRAG